MYNTIRFDSRINDIESKKFSYRFVLLNISLSHSMSLKIIPNDTYE